MKVSITMTGITDTTGLRAARDTLTNARIALQEAKDDHDFEKAAAESRAIAKLNGSLGKNEDERRRNITLELGTDREYQAARFALRQAEAAVLRAESELEAMQDQRRAEEWGIRLALVTALERASVPADYPGDDQSFEDAITEATSRKVINTTDRARAHAEMQELFN